MRERYSVKEMFLTLQGEGMNAGRRAVFVRMAGCNLWNGKPQDRHKGKGACALWCDTDFYSGVKMTADQIAERVSFLWGNAPRAMPALVVVTGGEPLLQIDDTFVKAIQMKGFQVAVETNGAAVLACKPDFITLSPKIGGPVDPTVQWVSEIKVVLPGHIDPNEGWTDAQLEAMRLGGSSGIFPRTEHFYVQPQDPIAYNPEKRQEEWARNMKRCVDFVLDHPEWRVSFQTHKALGVP